MMRWLWSAGGALLWLIVLGFLAWLLNLDDLVRASIQAGHALDWAMGVVCFVWLLVVLKAPWDLYFQAHAAAWEMQRSRERGIVLVPGREAYVFGLRRRLGLFAVAAHLLSAVLAAGVAYANGGVAVGYYFAVFFVASTMFRPAVAGYVYLSRKLRAVGEEVRYPREDVVELRGRVEAQEETLRARAEQTERLREALGAEAEAREAETRDLRQRLHALGREFETTVSRLTDNQEVIKGIQAFVRLIAQSAQQPSA